VGQVHAEHDDGDDDKHAKDDGRAGPHNRGPIGDAHAWIGAIREEPARLLKDYDIYDYYPKRNYELHESILTEAGRKVPC
jgi:hypothetical protein